LTTTYALAAKPDITKRDFPEGKIMMSSASSKFVFAVSSSKIYYDHKKKKK